MTDKPWQKAVLVYPRFDTQDTFWSYQTSLEQYSPRGEFGLPKRLLPPLGLMGLYNYLKAYYQQLQLIDRNVDPRPLTQLIAGADHIYMGGMMAQEQNMLLDARLIKQSGIPLIVGGTAIIPESPLLHFADHLIENEAEMVIDELINGLQQGNARQYYLGTPATPEKIFRPDYTSINLANYVHMIVQISRGCPENCEFCDIPKRFGKSFRLTPNDYTKASFQQLYQLGWRAPVFIVDDNFIGNPKKALQALKNLYEIGQEMGYHHPKYTELTLRLSEPTPIMAALREWFRKTHFTTNFYGVETPNKAALQETNKRQNLRGEQSIEAKLSFISEQTGSGVLMGMIYGFDHDSTETVSEFIDFVNATHVPVVMVGLLNALPKTPLMDRVKREGRYLQASSCNNSDGVINFIPWNFSIEQAEASYLKILQGIYHSDAYFQRVLRHLQLFAPKYATNARSSLENLSTLWKLMTRRNARVFWQHLPEAHKIAASQYALFSQGYGQILAEYFAHCGQYTHFIDQTQKQETRIKHKHYQPWQQFSWQQFLHSPIAQIDIIQEHKENPILTCIKVTMPFAYYVEGTRIEVLTYFVNPYFQQQLKAMDQALKPNAAVFIDVEVQCYYQAHKHRPKILDGLDFSLVETWLRQSRMQQLDYLPTMRRTHRKLLAIEGLNVVKAEESIGKSKRLILARRRASK